MPLAIELAAARVTVMNPTELLAGLDRRFTLLSGGRRRQRQRTLEATLDWSYDLLAPEEQRVLRVLGVFVDGFDIDAVASVANIEDQDALDLIEALVAKSLVERGDLAGDTRFRLLETVKAYAEDRLVDANETSVRDRHLDHFHSLATPRERIISGDLVVGMKLRADIPNVAAAFQWAVATDQWTRAVELLAGSSGAFDIELAWLDGVALIDEAIERGDQSRIDALEPLKGLRLGWFVYTYDPRLGPSLGELSTSPLAEARASALAIGAFAGAVRGIADSATAIEQAQQAIDSVVLEGSGADVHTARAVLLNARGVYAAFGRDFEAALDHYCQLIHTDGPLTTLHVRTSFSAAALLQALLGRRDTALETLDRMRSSGVPRVISEHALVMVAIQDGDLDQAEHHARVHATRALSGRYVGEAGDSLCLFAALNLAEGDQERARELIWTLQARTPAGVILSIHVSDQLQELDGYKRRVQATARDQFGSTAADDLATLRTEMARRGWA